MEATKKDLELINEATSTIKRLFLEGKHGIAATVLGKSGEMFSAVNLNAYTGKVDVCAEAIAIGKAIAAGERELISLVTVRHPRTGGKHKDIRVVTPCGICRELMCDYGVEYTFIQEGDVLKKIKTTDLLPNRFIRE